MHVVTLNDELTVIDQTITELEGRRTEILNKLETGAGPKLIQFPRTPAVSVEVYSGIPRPLWR